MQESKKTNVLFSIIKRMDLFKAISFVVLWAYLYFIFNFELFSNLVRIDLTFTAFLIVLSGASAFFLIFILGKYINKFNFSANNKKTYTLWIIVSAITFAFYLIYYFAWYPGGMSPDTRDQYLQAVGEAAYNDWHPVLHTLLFFTIPTKLGLPFSAITFIQLLLFSIVFGYLIFVLAKNNLPKLVLVLTTVFVVINPFLACYMVYPWKDIGFAIFALLVLTYYIQIFVSKGKWLNNKLNIVLFSTVLVVCNFMRHNAILFCLPLLLLVIFYIVKAKKIRLCLTAIVILSYIAVKLLYVAIDVEKPDKRKLELVGLPATVWCNVMQQNPDALPEETREFMYELASQYSYQNDYVAGNFNSIKWSGNIDTDKIDAMSYGKVVKYTLQCFKYAPKESVSALAKLTYIVWSIKSVKPTFTPSVMQNNPWEMKTEPNQFANELTLQLNSLFTGGIGNVVFGSIGFHLLVLIIFAAAMLFRRRMNFLHILPLCFYNFGTMLLLSGHDYRFFVITIVLWLPTLYLMIMDKNEFKTKEKKQ